MPLCHKLSVCLFVYVLDPYGRHNGGRGCNGNLCIAQKKKKEHKMLSGHQTETDGY